LVSAPRKGVKDDNNKKTIAIIIKNLEITFLFFMPKQILTGIGPKTKEKLLKLGIQKEMVPTIDDGHSGNTFGLACKLAIAYIPMIRDKKIDIIIT
jgi:uroporphyrinogen-III synthase